ncbi:MAG: hypothetical protein KC731_24765, partial [Myxococcales bacterium]|nr:hypothetical protein [Myxococcales bacterium]
SAAFELAQQVKRGDLPSPERVILPVGSNCTSAGLLLGFWLADRLGLGLSPRPVVVSVRVTPWPVTIPYRILGLALEAGKLLGELLGRPSLVPDRAALASHLEIDPRRLGPGYGFATDEGREAVRLWDTHVGHPLETTYSGKAAARVIAELHRGLDRPTLFWATKSSATLPEVNDDEVAWASRRMRRWMAQAVVARD